MSKKPGSFSESRKFTRSELGVAFVQMALVILPILLLVFFLTKTGWTSYKKSQLQYTANLVLKYLQADKAFTNCPFWEPGATCTDEFIAARRAAVEKFLSQFSQWGNLLQVEYYDLDGGGLTDTLPMLILPPGFGAYIPELNGGTEILHDICPEPRAGTPSFSNCPSGITRLSTGKSLPQLMTDRATKVAFILEEKEFFSGKTYHMPVTTGGFTWNPGEVTPTPSFTPTASGTPTITATIDPSITPSETPTASATSTDTPTHTPTETPTDTPTATPTETQTGTITPELTPEEEITPEITEVPTEVPTEEPEETSTPTVSPTPTETVPCAGGCAAGLECCQGQCVPLGFCQGGAPGGGACDAQALGIPPCPQGVGQVAPVPDNIFVPDQFGFLQDTGCSMCGPIIAVGLCLPVAPGKCAMPALCWDHNCIQFCGPQIAAASFCTGGVLKMVPCPCNCPNRPGNDFFCPGWDDNGGCCHDDELCWPGFQELNKGTSMCCETDDVPCGPNPDLQNHFTCCDTVSDNGEFATQQCLPWTDDGSTPEALPNAHICCDNGKEICEGLSNEACCEEGHCQTKADGTRICCEDDTNGGTKLCADKCCRPEDCTQSICADGSTGPGCSPENCCLTTEEPCGTEDCCAVGEQCANIIIEETTFEDGTPILRTGLCCADGGTACYNLAGSDPLDMGPKEGVCCDAGLACNSGLGECCPSETKICTGASPEPSDQCCPLAQDCAGAQCCSDTEKSTPSGYGNEGPKCCPLDSPIHCGTTCCNAGATDCLYDIVFEVETCVYPTPTHTPTPDPDPTLIVWTPTPQATATPQTSIAVPEVTMMPLPTNTPVPVPTCAAGRIPCPDGNNCCDPGVPCMDAGGGSYFCDVPVATPSGTSGPSCPGGQIQCPAVDTGFGTICCPLGRCVDAGGPYFWCS